MEKTNWVRHAITVLSCLTAIMFLMNLAPGIPVLAGEYDLSGSIEAAKKAEAELRERARQAEDDAIMAIAKDYEKQYLEAGYSETEIKKYWDNIWAAAKGYYEKNIKISK